MADSVSVEHGGVTIITLPLPSRLRRAIRWPVLLWRYRCRGVTWRTAWRLTHWVIWYQVKHG